MGLGPWGGAPQRCVDSKTVKRPRQQPAHPQYANYWAPLTRKRYIPPHSAQPQHTNHWAPRTRKRHQQEHRPQRPTESSDPMQHAKGRTGDRPGPRKGATTRRNVTQGVPRPPPGKASLREKYVAADSTDCLDCRDKQACWGNAHIWIDIGGEAVAEVSRSWSCEGCERLSWGAGGGGMCCRQGEGAARGVVGRSTLASLLCVGGRAQAQGGRGGGGGLASVIPAPRPVNQHPPPAPPVRPLHRTLIESKDVFSRIVCPGNSPAGAAAAGSRFDSSTTLHSYLVHGGCL